MFPYSSLSLQISYSIYLCFNKICLNRLHLIYYRLYTSFVIKRVLKLTIFIRGILKLFPYMQCLKIIISCIINLANNILVIISKFVNFHCGHCSISSIFDKSIFPDFQHNNTYCSVRLNVSILKK